VIVRWIRSVASTGRLQMVEVESQESRRQAEEVVGGSKAHNDQLQVSNGEQERAESGPTKQGRAERKFAD
jgi:hypothetical protein